jgi:heme/copper-type cytochrome/quinol oxidase subunit 2
MAFHMGQRKDTVSIEAVYSQLYSEMRRARDHQVTIAAWYTTILLTINGALLFLKRDQSPIPLSNLEKWAVSIVLVILTVGVCYLFWFEHIRYCEYRRCAQSMEPEWKLEGRRALRIKPPVVYTLIIWFLAFLVVLTLWRGSG